MTLDNYMDNDVRQRRAISDIDRECYKKIIDIQNYADNMGFIYRNRFYKTIRKIPSLHLSHPETQYDMYLEALYNVRF